MVIYNKKMKIMKKLIFTTVAISALFLSVSCQKENVNDAPKGEGVVFTAYVDGVDPVDSDTKTVIQKDGDNSISYWNGVEEIGVLDGVLDKPKVYSATVDKPSPKAIFTETDSNISLSGTSYIALYPAKPAGSASWQGEGTTVNGLWLTGNQTPFEGTYDPISHIAIATAGAEDTNLMFKNATSYFKFTVAADNISEVCIFSHLGEKISGNFRISLDEAKNPVVTPYGNSLQTYSKIEANEEYTIASGTTYYIGVLPCKFNAGFSVEYVSDGVKSTVKTTTKEYELKRNKIIDLGTIENQAVDVKHVYLEASTENWAAANAVLAVYYFDDNKNDGWAQFRKTSVENMYVASIPSAYSKIILTRHKPESGINWGSTWNQTDNLDYAKGPYFKITGYKDGKGVVESRKSY